MQRPHVKGSQFGGVPNNKGPNVGYGGSKFDKVKDDQNKNFNNKVNDPKKIDQVKSNDPTNSDSLPKRVREDDNAQAQKKVRTTQTCSDPISGVGQAIIQKLKDLYEYVFGSKKNQ